MALPRPARCSLPRHDHFHGLFLVRDQLSAHVLGRAVERPGELEWRFVFVPNRRFSLFVPLEFLTRLDVGIRGCALRECADAREHRGSHPAAIQTLLDKVPLLNRIIDQIEYQRPLRLMIGPLVLSA